MTAIIPRTNISKQPIPPAPGRVAEPEVFTEPQAAAASAAPVAPTDGLVGIYAALAAPFPTELVELKPGATTADKTRALALAYVDSRGYQDRLDAVVGPDNWQVAYRQLGDNALVCRLQILGITREEIGECADPRDANRWTVASAQAFKRACSAFGLGRYLYSLGRNLWADFNGDKKWFKDERGRLRGSIAMLGWCKTQNSETNWSHCSFQREGSRNPTSAKKAPSSSKVSPGICGSEASILLLWNRYLEVQYELGSDGTDCRVWPQ